MKAVPVILWWVLIAIYCSDARNVRKRKIADLNSNNSNAYQNMSNNLSIQNMDQATSLQSEADSAISSQKSTEREKRAVPAAIAEIGTEVVTDVIKQAVEKQMEIIAEAQEKAEAFIGKKLELNIEPEKGWQTESMFVPAGMHIDAEYTNEKDTEEWSHEEPPFTYPMGLGGVMMNGCYGSNYQKGDPCYDFKTVSSICFNLIDGAAFIGVGFDGRGDYSPESRKMSIVQRVCSGKATYDGDDVPDTMNVHGVYDTSTSMHSFYSRQEYQKFLQRQAGMSGSLFGFFAGVKKAWGSSEVRGSEKYMSLLSIDVDRYEIYLDEVKPNDLSVNFLQEFMDLPTFYLAPGAAIKFQNFILRWGTHYIKSGKFGGRLQIFKTMEGSQVSSKEEFSRVMEVGYKTLLGSFHSKDESKEGSSFKSQSKTSSTSISVEGGDQKIAAIITDFNSPTIKYDLTQWLASIPTFPKPFKFMVAPITDLLKFNPSSLFTDEERDWGCEAHTADMKQDPETNEHYYEVKINGTMIKKFCPYKDRDTLVNLIDRKRNGLERAIAVYMEEGPISASDITLPAGIPGCQTENYNFQKKAGKPSWKEMAENGATFLVIFNTNEDLLSGSFHGPVDLSPHKEKYVRYFKGEWLVGESRDDINYMTGCHHGSLEDKKICIVGLLLTYNEESGFLTLAKEDLEFSKKSFPKLTDNIIGTLMAHVEWPSEHIFQLDKVVGYLPCNVKWSNVLRFDPSNDEGKCLHFTASSQGTIFVIFAAVPNNKDTWYYVQISPYGVGIFKSQKLMVSTVDVNAVGLGAAILYQSYFVCLKETSQSTVIEYGKSFTTTESGDVYLTMLDRDEPLSVRFYSFGNGEKPLEVVDAHIVSRRLTKANCRGDTVLDKQTNMCVQHCHELCDPTQGCRGGSSDKPLATNCNACRYVKDAVTGECLRECPDGYEQQDDKTCKKKQPCDGVKCFNGGTCKNMADGTFKCECVQLYFGDYCEKEPCEKGECLNGAVCKNIEGGTFRCYCALGYRGQYCEEEECTKGNALGMESGLISDSQISASSQHDLNHAAIQGRLNFKETSKKSGGWSAKSNYGQQWLQIDLRNLDTKVAGVATQGRNYGTDWPYGPHRQWISKYMVQYSNDGKTFAYFKEPGKTTNKVFPGNSDRDTVVYHDLRPPIQARYIRFRPTVWTGGISMRVELYGCKDETCNDIHKKGMAEGNKAYPLTLGSRPISAYCHMTNDGLGECGGGGWTLAMKIDGTKKTFKYDSELWSNGNTYNLEGGKTGLDAQETKLPSYWSTPFSKICLGMKVDNQFTFAVVNKPASSLFSLIADGDYHATFLGRNSWKRLIGSKASLQVYCNKEGFNAVSGGNTKARIGIIANDQDNCDSCNSLLGFGLGPYDEFTCGNEARHSADNGNQFTPAVGYIFVQ